ncbi:MAG: muconolactone Delta-isomerase family protein [Thermodesulfobacteriota bacterium]
MKYLVTANESGGFYSSDEVAQILEQMVIPAFDELEELESDGALVGGVPVGERAFVFIVEAESHDDVDRTLRSLPLWGVMDWEVTPLQDFESRASHEREILKELNKRS